LTSKKTSCGVWIPISKNCNQLFSSLMTSLPPPLMKGGGGGRERKQFLFN
jgi:hypothetical protein